MEYREYKKQIHVLIHIYIWMMGSLRKKRRYLILDNHIALLVSFQPEGCTPDRLGRQHSDICRVKEEMLGSLLP